MTTLPPPPVPPAPEGPAPSATHPPPTASPPTEEAGARSRPSRRRWIAAGIVLAVMLVGSAGVVWSVARSDRCAGVPFRSARFGYCVRPPEGWRAEPADGGTVDRFWLPDAAAVIHVQAVETVGRSLDDVAAEVRSLEEGTGYEVGDPASIRVGGELALWWEARATSPLGDAIRVRDVVVVVDELAWRVRFADDEAAFDEHIGAFETFLRSWRFA